jgi:hypothetical protein
MTLTLDLHAIFNRLLYKHPDLVAWMDTCEICIAEERGGGHCTQVIIRCQFLAVAELLFFQQSRLSSALAQGIPLSFCIIYKDEVVVSFRRQALQSLHQATPGLRGFTMVLAAEANAPTNITNSQPIVNLGQIQEPIQGMIRQQLVNLKLPVYPREDGNYDVPQTSFDAAWQILGDVMKRGSEFQLGTTKEASELRANASTGEPKQKEKTAKPRLFSTSITAEDITLGGKAAIKRTLFTVLGKVNLKNQTEAEVLTAIVNRAEYGMQLLSKIGEAYAKKDILYKVKPEEWAKVESKIIAACQERLNPPIEKEASTQAKSQGSKEKSETRRTEDSEKEQTSHVESPEENKEPPL